MILTPELFEPALDLPLDDEAVVHLFLGSALVRPTVHDGPLRWGICRRLGVAAGRVHPVGRLGGVNHLAVALADDLTSADLPEGWQANGLRNWFGAIDEASLAIAMRSVQILEWDRTHRFCGACATPTAAVTHERARRCPACGLVSYPRISPAMMALVVRGRELLLGRGLTFPPGRYSALAGFLEAGESIEDAIRREVREEASVEVDDLRYFASQSWPFPNSLMIAFSARYAGGELRPDPAELADARWFDVDALPQLPPRLSIARALIDDTVARIRAGTFGHGGSDRGADDPGG
jgi:NAD+ diphosphatase